MSQSPKTRRLFNLIKNLRFLDYLIIGALLLGAIILFKIINPEEKWINVEVLVPNVPIFQATGVVIGDNEKESSGKSIAQITGVDIYDTQEPTKTTNSNKDVFMKAKILVEINPRTREYEYKNKVIKVGAPIEMRLSSVAMKGVVSDIEGSVQNKKKETKILTLRVYEQWPWVGDNLEVGQGELDSNGQKIIEILSKDIKPAEVTIDTSSGQKVFGINPQKVDITIKIKVQAQRVNNELIIRKNERLLAGEPFSFTTNKAEIKNASIINIE